MSPYFKLHSLAEDHLGVTTIVEVDTEDMTVDDLADPEIFRVQEEL